MSKRHSGMQWRVAESTAEKKADDLTSKDKADGNALWRVPSWFEDLPPAHLEVLQQYHSELLKFNLKLNLISRSTERDADEVHFADSILGSKIVLRVLGNAGHIYDIGSGNGLPGIVLAILAPHVRVSMVESDTRKAEFLKHVTHTLKLSNAEVLNIRLESLTLGDEVVAVSRGFASISKSVLACNRLFPVGGRFFHLKGSNWSTEIAELPVQVMPYWNPELVGEYALPVSQARRAVVCTKKIR